MKASLNRSQQGGALGDEGGALVLIKPLGSKGTQEGYCSQNREGVRCGGSGVVLCSVALR